MPQPSIFDPSTFHRKQQNLGLMVGGKPGKVLSADIREWLKAGPGKPRARGAKSRTPPAPRNAYRLTSMDWVTSPSRRAMYLTVACLLVLEERSASFAFWPPTVTFVEWLTLKPKLVPFESFTDTKFLSESTIESVPDTVPFSALNAVP